MRAYLYPEDLNQQYTPIRLPEVDHTKALEIVRGELQLAELSLDKLDVIPDSIAGKSGQILLVQVSAKDLEAANRSLLEFLDSLFQLMNTANAKYGISFVLCHLRLLDGKGNILLDYVQDVETGSTQWSGVPGLYNGWYSQPISPGEILAVPTIALPLDAYPPPSTSTPYH